MHGYAGKILRVNLTTQEITIEEPNEQFYRRYMGGWNWIAYYLLRDEMKCRCAALKNATPLTPNGAAPRLTTNKN